jgi:LysM repeat protein
MKKALENSCLKGCVVYFVVLVLVLIFGAAGLGNIAARFGGGGQATKEAAPAQTAPNGNASNSSQAGETSVQIAVQEAPTPQSQQSTSLPPTPSPAPALPQAAAPNDSGQAQVQAQGGTISGQASVPFYIVQAGDTLWGIATTYGTKVEDLRSLNKLGEEYIKPGQLLYLPQANMQPAPAPGVVEGAPPPIPPAGPVPGATGTPVPLMPNTGINAEP